MVGRSTSKNKPSRTRPLGSLLLETVRLRAEFTRRSGCAAPSLSWPPAVLAAPHCIPLPTVPCRFSIASRSRSLPPCPCPGGRAGGTPTPAAAPVHSRFENSSRSSDAAVLGSWAAAPASLLARPSHPPLFPSCAAPLALRISHPFRNPCRS